ncbi:DUF4446 domain-containing protein [Clostridium botulinum]|uniref:DUF4446 domain-containing protein n=1 Tax=Clostridium botulinum TaxID=1491 RepID=A0ABC8CYI5_CLOBO|nr:DUF4446 family protein [Clostridium botulinum]AVQ40444.1 DUF4446 domain-containing protein [Clostridium botulinum]EJE7236158.1 DUF4446 family protein [Clostridium botulinum]
MTNVIEFININSAFIIMGLTAIMILLFIILIITMISLKKLKEKYKKFMRGSNNRNVEELINDYLDKVDKAKEETEYVKEIYSTIDKRVKACIQKVAIVRYRAFDDVGSDLSYSIAFLDNDNSGVILTSIFGRNESTTYAKPIDKGISRYDLSDEEKQVLENCINNVTEN